MECSGLSREGAGLAKPPKHLWRQPRTHIRIKQRYHSDTERYLCCNRATEKHRPDINAIETLHFPDHVDLLYIPVCFLETLIQCPVSVSCACDNSLIDGSVSTKA
ncbi:hypothetical protein QQF64_003518 [Cirrhinus molitorella]|uniref:Uncharacterized protein n=1 Tax=Cirrhinus molitorella TaxID=172907 RepID=A0ABR3MLJ7_9TELE